MQLTELLSDYVAIALVDGSPKTIRLYGLVLQRLEEFVGSPPTLDCLTDLWLGKFLRSRLDAGKSPNTVQGERAKLHALWTFACRRGLVKEWPQSKPLKTPRRVPQAWTKEELDLLWQACDFAHPVGDVPGHVWWRTLFCVLFDTGERIGATISIRWEWIDFQAKQIRIPAEYRKGGVVERAYEVSRRTIELLREMPHATAGPFIVRLSMETLYIRLTKLLKRAGLPTDHKSKFHRFRATVASHVAAAGGSAQDQLGHSSQAVTRRYLDPRIVKPPAACQVIPFRLGSPPAEQSCQP